MLKCSAQMVEAPLGIYAQVLLGGQFLCTYPTLDTTYIDSYT